MEDKGFRLRHGTINFERRKHPRVNIDLPVVYLQMDSILRNNGRAFNVSEGGLLIYLPDPVEIGQHLKMILSFISETRLDSIEMITEVVWRDITFDMVWGDFRCGVKIVDIAPEEMIKLKDFLRNLFQQPESPSDDFILSI
jgi:c-di-GMP-binding flagellar brake protein YcgR